MKANIVLLPGDGVGPEAARAARGVLEAVASAFGHDFAFAEHLIGGVAIDATGEPLPEATLADCRAADAIFLGAVGGPKWDGGAKRPEQGLLAIRSALGLFANLRPVTVDAALIDRSPLKAEAVRGIDILIVRELTSGLYFGERGRDDAGAFDVCRYSTAEIERIARVAFEAARKRKRRLTSVDKANVLDTSKLWREVVSRIGHDDYPDVTLDHALVDSTAMKLITNPRGFDVIVTENMFGDILSDEASVLAGSIGLLGSASLGAGDGPGIFEPIHGSAPDIAGRDLANPIGAIRSAAMLLRFGLNLEAEAQAVEQAVSQAIDAGQLTADLGGMLGTQAVAGAIAERVRASRRLPGSSA